MKDWIWEFGVDKWASIAPKRTAVIDAQVRLSYQNFKNMTEGLADCIRQIGVTPQDYILIGMPNCAEFAVVLYAAMRLHIPVASLNPQFREDEIAAAMRTLRPKLAFVKDGDFAALLRRYSDSVRILHASFSDPHFMDMVSAAPMQSVRPPACREDEVCAAVYTSGTTGDPKFVVRSYQAQLTLGWNKLRSMHANERDVLLITLPLCQQFGQGALQMGLMVGGTSVLTEKFQAEQALDLIAQHRVTLQFGVPTMFIREMHAYQARTVKPDLRSLKSGIVSGAVSDDAFIRWLNSFGCHILNSYGMTETGSVTAPDFGDPLTVRCETVGRKFSDAQILICDPKGRPVPDGAVGELRCKTPSIMLGYVGKPEETRACFDENGWFCTGDLARQNPDGTIIIVGRKKDIIIRGGYNVVPAEVESVYLRHPLIEEVCVMGYPDAELGERICAFLRTKDDTAIDSAQLRAYGAEHLARYKLPDRFIRLDVMPRLQTQKYNKRVLLSLTEADCISTQKEELE